MITMDKNAATTTVKLLNEMSDILNKLTTLSMGLPDREDQVSIRKHLGPMMLENIDLMNYVTKQYPELHPDRKD